jgi:DNA-binding NarL/FixJ family response regulator
VKILVVEDHALVREGLVMTLKGLAQGGEVVGVGDAQAAIAILESDDIDLMMLDLMLPGTRGETLLPVVRRRFPTVPVVVLSALDDANTVAGVIKKGASGFISKASSSDDLLAALQKVLAGDIFVPPHLREAVNRKVAKITETGGVAHNASRSVAQRYALTPAQERVLHHLGEGNTNRRIADLLGLTEGTVKIHVSAIIKALNVENRAEAALVISRKVRR